MTLASGVDIIEIERVKASIERHGDRFLQRVYTPAELQACRGRVESLAARFAAKEAASKALGCGIGDVGWREIEVIGDAKSAPTIRLHGEAENIARKRGLTQWTISLSHTAQYAMAFVVALGE